MNICLYLQIFQYLWIIRLTDIRTDMERARISHLFDGADMDFTVSASMDIH
jgi:hypothetical protein